MSLCITSSSNIRIFEDKSADLTRQTYGDVRFDKSTIRHRIFEYSGSTESKCCSLKRGTTRINMKVEVASLPDTRCKEKEQECGDGRSGHYGAMSWDGRV